MTESTKEIVSQQESIHLSNGGVEVEIDTRGAFLNKLEINGEEIIYTPRKDNPKRGGIPILGPTPGPVEGSKWGNLYSEESMPSHGTDRVVKWRTVDQSQNSVTLSRFIGPKEFGFTGEKRITFRTTDDGLRIKTVISNHEDKSREIGHALHPYFNAQDGLSVDNEIIEKHRPLEAKKPIVITDKESHELRKIKIKIGNSTYEVSSDPPPTNFVLWSDNPDLYECLEPWWAGLGEGDIVDGNSTKTYTFEIRKVG